MGETIKKAGQHESTEFEIGIETGRESQSHQRTDCALSGGLDLFH